jgi:chemotaxis protein MotB
MKDRGHVGRRRATAGQARHADDWLMTYADTITLLLCLFAVLLAVHLSNVPRGSDTVASVASGTPGVSASLPDRFVPESFVIVPPREASPDDDSDDAATATSAGTGREAPADSGMATAPTSAPDVPADLAAVAQPAPAAGPRVPAAPVVRSPSTSRPAAGDSHTPLPLPQVTTAMPTMANGRPAPTGARIVTFQFSSAAFFATGSATLSGAGRTILGGLIGRLQSPEFTGYRITVEGHTDDEPVSTLQFPSNWELSTARAAAVVRFLLDQRIAARRVRAAGYADTRPLAPNRDAEGHPIPQNQARNRRVVIELEKIDRGSD